MQIVNFLEEVHVNHQKHQVADESMFRMSAPQARS